MDLKNKNNQSGQVIKVIKVFKNIVQYAVYNLKFKICSSYCTVHKVQCPLWSILSGTIHPSVVGSWQLINGTCCVYSKCVSSIDIRYCL